MSAALDTLLAELGTRVAHASELASILREPTPLSLGWALDDALPDGGLPRGVTELSGAHALGGATSVAISAVRAAQALDGRAYCAWIDPFSTLYAPGLAQRGVDLSRLVVIRPPLASVGRIAVKVVGSRAFELAVVDMNPCAGCSAPILPREQGPRERKPVPPEVIVRKLSLLAEEGGTRVLLVTDRNEARRAPWPVALRLELERTRENLTVRVAKDKRGRVGVKKTVPFHASREVA